ncbi:MULTISPECIES: hypothetical protein [Bradyrhizobium]|uniref:hypothetical protein n=1 Tax=Bradyrhizobium elkanii TaxID=29448 RepID=UPI0027153A37|nr:hypothetical protein [Bradyrhizobium elkanii]WLB84899.1 hypothetical protein QIH83_21065 [Bradyrhizobium elkanii]
MKPQDISLARACMELNLRVLDSGGQYPPIIDATLCEDQRTVLLEAPDGQGNWVTASYELDQPTTEEAFDEYRRSVFD